MTATVVSLASRRRQQPLAGASCTACRRGTDGRIRECYPHRLDSLARRLTLLMVANADSLLIDRDVFADAVADALEVIHSITDECLPESERDAR